MLEFELKISLEEAERVELPNFWWDGMGHGVAEIHEKEQIEELLALMLDRKVAVSWRPYEAKDWVAEQQLALAPVQVGKLFLFGPHHDVAPPAGTLPLCIDAKNAFGSGHHPTTRTCLELLQELTRVDAMLDMGCGSGILALATELLFGATAIGCDNDPASVEAALSSGVKALLTDAPPAGKYDLVMANIHSGVLISLSEQIKAVATDRIILSGILPEQADEVIAAFAPFSLSEKRIVEGWVTLMLQFNHGID